MAFRIIDNRKVMYFFICVDSNQTFAVDCFAMVWGKLRNSCLCCVDMQDYTDLSLAALHVVTRWRGIMCGER